MRTPNNEGLTSPKRRGTVGRRSRPAPPEAAGPIRSCILTRDRAAQRNLVRLALAPDGEVHPDVRAKAPGRGAWIGVNRAELEDAIAGRRLRGALARAFKGAELTVPGDLPQRIADALQRNALDRLGLESRAGTLLTGSDRIENAARAGQLRALYHAADAREDGTRRLAQAWRVGSDREGSDLRGLALPVARTILSLALGRENVVHLGLTDRLAAARVSEALDRWLHFIGPDPQSGGHRDDRPAATHPAPCDSVSQGASAPGTVPDASERNEDFE